MAAVSEAPTAVGVTGRYEKLRRKHHAIFDEHV
jgi:hypothetical protein